MPGCQNFRRFLVNIRVFMSLPQGSLWGAPSACAPALLRSARWPGTPGRKTRTMTRRTRTPRPSPGRSGTACAERGNKRKSLTFSRRRWETRLKLSFYNCKTRSRMCFSSNRCAVRSAIVGTCRVLFAQHDNKGATIFVRQANLLYSFLKN